MRLPFRKARQDVPKRAVDACSFCGGRLGGAVFTVRDGLWADRAWHFHEDRAMCRLAGRSSQLNLRQVYAYMERTGWTMCGGITGSCWIKPHMQVVELSSTTGFLISVALCERRTPDDVLYDMLAQDLLDEVEATGA